MKFDVENLIYIYMIICAALIVFNMVCIIYFRSRETVVSKKSEELVNYPKKKIRERKLRRENNLVALEKALDYLKDNNTEEFNAYISIIKPIFSKIISKRKEKDELIRAYIYYLCGKYGILFGCTSRPILNSVVSDACSRDIYLKINALRLTFSMGNIRFMSEVIESMDCCHVTISDKLMFDGMMSFTGDKKELADRLWFIYPMLSLHMQMIILNYFRFTCGDYKEKMLEIMTDPSSDKELVFSCMRYFQKYKYEPAYPYIVEFAKARNDGVWEYNAIAANALASYPCEETFNVLCELLSSRNFRIRSNAAQSLINQGYDEETLNPILNGSDRFAKDALEFRLVKKHQTRKGAKA